MSTGASSPRGLCLRSRNRGVSEVAPGYIAMVTAAHPTCSVAGQHRLLTHRLENIIPVDISVANECLEQFIVKHYVLKTEYNWLLL